MSIELIASRLVELSNQGQFETAQKELFAENAVSIEPAGSMGLQTVEGLENIVAKGHHFQQMIEEFHGVGASAPVIAGNHFSVSCWIDVTMKGFGRKKMEEIVVYQVSEGKIVKEQFFY